MSGHLVLKVRTVEEALAEVLAHKRFTDALRVTRFTLGPRSYIELQLFKRNLTILAVDSHECALIACERANEILLAHRRLTE
jgi:hypothetical protein